ncbi:putative PPOX class F420-dependent enzyme [Frankia canadensis]|uniref:Putative PPOX class F420-dependent enzyme n=1 Tax=Frankia canadensis TaxID=1836972 RepID=A0A2I2KUZ6_9ACTN|nr:PPOX class F420-dependent oxidoreductase [Frankia canadensis]SNQ49484.1 putative PPOX class F420-dependent enzyme [Frankia canadensis]SOU56774.1 putative PPOX class F420-dependent enzyme [Frankia canadensis]
MATMNESQWRRFVSEGTRTGKLATTRADGRPHVAPVWFLLDGADVVFNTGAQTVKGRALRRDGQAALCVDDERPPFSFVTLSGPVTVSEELTEVRHWATRIAARYMGEELAEQYGARNGVPGELLVRLTPTSVVALADLAD